MATLYGAIEAGGTKFVCAVGRGPDALLETATFPTTEPEKTFGQCLAFFRDVASEHGKLASLGIASFGPIDCRVGSEAYGYITTTPKEGWAQTDFVGTFAKALDLPVGFDTDVNAAALAEWRWGCARDLDTCLYVTVGTGIGGGFVHRGTTLKGLLHPEMGHVRIHRLPEDGYSGNCPYHGHQCLEGLAAGPALAKRWGTQADALPPDHIAWTWQADYLAQAAVNWIVTLSPEVIVLGGGVMQQQHLFPQIRDRVRALLNGYLQVPAILDASPDFIRQPGLGTQSGILGALALAMDAA